MAVFTQNQEPATKLMLSSSCILLKDGVKGICLWAQYQSCSGHHMENPIVLVDASSKKKVLAAIATQPRPTLYYKVGIVFLVHTIKGWCQSFMSMCPISVQFWPLHSKFYKSSQIMDPTAVATKPRPTPCYKA
jgi:hypothetical protein